MTSGRVEKDLEGHSCETFRVNLQVSGPTPRVK